MAEKPRGRVTIKDVARRAAVSPATVSLVLNNAPGVSSVTREKVIGVMSEINYTPDALARSFSSRRAQTIALVMPSTLESLDDPYFTHLLRGVLEAARDRGYKLLLEIADDRFVAQRLWEDLFQSRRVDGIVVATPLLSQGYLTEVSAGGYPTLLFNGARPDLPDLDFVGYDDLRCGMDATYYLIGLGHRRIAHLAGPDNEASARARLEGYRQALERARIPFREEDILPGDYKAECGATALNTLLTRPVSERPTAVFSANDTMAIALMKAAQAAGRTVPGDFSIIGVDDTGSAVNARPALTTLRQDIQTLANRGAAQFLKKLDERTGERVHECLPMPLIERDSCAPLSQTEGRKP